MAAPINPKPQKPSFILYVLKLFLRPLGSTRMGHCTFIGRSNQACVFLQRASQAVSYVRFPLRPACSQFLLGHMQLHAALGSIDGDTVAVFYQTDVPTGCCFGAGIADTHAACRTGETAIRQQCHFFAIAMTINGGSDT